GPRHDGHDQAQAPCPCLIPLRIFVDKGLELLNTIQNSLQAHPVPNSCFGFCQNPKHRIRSGCAISGPSGFPPLRYFRYNSARPGRRTGQRWEPTRAPTQGPGPKRGVVHDAPFGSPQKNQRTSGLAQSDKSSRKYSPSLFLAPITPATRVPLLTYRADLTHRFPRGPKKVKGFQPLQLIWEGKIVDAIFRRGKRHSNYGNDVEKMIRGIVSLIRTRYSASVDIVIRKDAGFFDEANFRLCDQLGIGFIGTGKTFQAVKEQVAAIGEKEWKVYDNGRQKWSYAGYDYGCDKWENVYRALYTRLNYEGPQQLLE